MATMSAPVLLGLACLGMRPGLPPMASTRVRMLTRASLRAQTPPPESAGAVAPASPAAIPVAADAPAAQPQSEFQWTKQWYPVAVVEYLDPEKPHAMQLLGMDVVLWNDGKIEGATATTTKKERKRGQRRTGGTWRCFEDACPHRLAPLSEGRVEETGELLCAYHGWRFEGGGGCTAIPQAAPGDEEQRLMANPKAQCNAFPTMEADGLLWVWPESGPNAALEAAATRAPALVPELHDDALRASGRVKQLPWNVRELPYGWDYFVENVNDPAHVSVSHHGIVGSRYSTQNRFEIELDRPVSAQDGFSLRVLNEGMEPGASSTNDFRPPALTQLTSENAQGGKMILALYATPTKPGFCRHIGCQVLVKNRDGSTPRGIGAFDLPMPKWLLHVTASLFLNQDAVFLHRQEKILAKKGYEARAGGGSYARAVYTPTQADKALLTFRGWLEQRAGGGVPWRCDPTLPPAADEKALFDVYESHVKDCQYCLGALVKLRRARALSFVASALLATAARAVIGVVPATGLAALAAGVGCALGKLISLFYRYEFSHANNN